MRSQDISIEFEKRGVLGTILKFSVPSSIGAIIGMICTLTDRYFIGQVAGRAGMSAIAIVFPYVMIMNSITFLFSGVAIVIGVKLGEKDRKSAEQILGASFLWIFILGIVLSIFLWIFDRQILIMLGATESNIFHAMEYTRYLIPIAIFQILLGQSTLIRGIGDPITAMGVNIFTAVLNIILDYIFIMKFNMGIAGASMATFIATALSATYVLYYFTNSRTLRLKKKYMKLSFSVLNDVFKIGSPRFYNQLLQSSVVMVTNRRAGLYGGEIAMAAIGIISIVRNVINTSLMGFNQGTAAIISYNYGARNFKRVKEVFKVQLKTVITISTLLVITMLLNTDGFVGFFVKNDTALIEFTSNAMRMNLFLMTLTAVLLSCNNFFQAIKDSRKASQFFMMRIIVLNIPLLYILPYFLGENGVWLAFPVADGLTAGLIYLSVSREIKRMS